MADHSKPTLTSNYTAFVDEIKGRLEDISKGFDPAKTSPTNVPVDTIRWVSSSNKWQRWNGSAWVDLASTYAISISGSAAKLATARSIALAGGATGSASFDGSANITINVTALNPSQLSSPVPLDKGGTGAASAAQARTNLGLGTAATRDVTSGGGDVTAGRVPTVGWMGLGNPLEVMLNDGDDLNNITGANRFFAWQNANILNNPTSSRWGAGLTFGWMNGEGLTQIVWGSGGPRWYLRQRNNSSSAWSSWVEIYHSGNLPAIDWNSLTGKPSTFPPSSHTHPWSQVTGAPATATRWPSWGEVTGKPNVLTAVPTGHGGVGTYAFAGYTGGTASWGGTYSGIWLANASQVKQHTVGGTWRCMGSYATSSAGTVFVRIA